MVLDYYQLREHAFGVTPDSRFLFMSATHKEALASLLYGLEAGCGFVALIAPPGLGKTTLLFHTLSFLRDRVTTVFLFQTVRTPADLLRAILADLGVAETGESLPEMQSRLKGLLTEQLRKGKRVVVVIDEAQNLDGSVLELVRMLSNFETPREKLIQIILSGQPQLAEKIGSPELVQLRQRVSIIAHLEPFSASDTALYIDHRLRTAGYEASTPLFSKDAIELIARHSEGIPRNINNLCFNALSIGCALKRQKIGGDIIREVVSDLDLARWQNKKVVVGRPGPLALPVDTPNEKIHEAPHEMPMFATVGGGGSSSGRWIPRIAVGVAAMLALPWMVFAGHRWFASREARPGHHYVSSVSAAVKSLSRADQSPKPKPQPEVKSAAPSQTTVSVAAAPAALQVDDDLHMADATDIIQVKPGRTLLGICEEKFGSCNAKLLQEIHRLNPKLTNPDHIEPGQSIRIPVLEAMRGTTAPPGKAPLEEKSSQ